MNLLQLLPAVRLQHNPRHITYNLIHPLRQPLQRLPQRAIPPRVAPVELVVLCEGKPVRQLRDGAFLERADRRPQVGPAQNCKVLGDAGLAGAVRDLQGAVVEAQLALLGRGEEAASAGLTDATSCSGAVVPELQSGFDELEFLVDLVEGLRYLSGQRIWGGCQCLFTVSEADISKVQTHL